MVQHEHKDVGWHPHEATCSRIRREDAGGQIAAGAAHRLEKAIDDLRNRQQKIRQAGDCPYDLRETTMELKDLLETAYCFRRSGTCLVSSRSAHGHPHLPRNRYPRLQWRVNSCGIVRTHHLAPGSRTVRTHPLPIRLRVVCLLSEQTAVPAPSTACPSDYPRVAPDSAASRRRFAVTQGPGPSWWSRRPARRPCCERGPI